MPLATITPALLLGAALALIYLANYCWRPASLLKTLVKTGSVAVPALALTLFGAPALPLAALWACALGDFLLSRDGDLALKAGIGAFALGHILYVVGFWVHFSPELGGSALALWLPAVLLLLGLSTEFWLRPHTGELRLPVRIYVALILVMGCIAAQPPIPQTTILAGALAFILSDLLLSIQIFITSGGVYGRVAPFLIWFFYYAAQVLIFYGFIV